MTPQVCYIEKMLQLYISPEAVIDPHPEELVMWREDEAAGFDVYFSDTDGITLHHEAEFGLAEFTVLLPATCVLSLNYIKEIIERYKLPAKHYTILFR